MGPSELLVMRVWACVYGRQIEWCMHCAVECSNLECIYVTSTDLEATAAWSLRHNKHTVVLDKSGLWFLIKIDHEKSVIT